MATEMVDRTTARIPAYLDDVIFPASRSEILRCAEDNDAPDTLLDAIERLPEVMYMSIGELLARIARNTR